MLQKDNNLLAAILYSDIFDYPLTKEEVKKYQIANNALKIKGKVVNKNGFYYLQGRGKIIQERLQREKISEKKILLAKKIAHMLKYIPTVQCIGLSGSLAMHNAKETDDIDFFVITRARTLWITRFFILLALSLFGIRRKKFDHQTNNKVCVNMLVDENCLTLPKQNLYTAHEVIQMKPLVIKNNMYQNFLQANKWVKEFLPNGIETHPSVPSPGGDRKTQSPLHRRGKGVGSFLELFAKKIQIWYMKKYRTNEIITDTLLAFHPEDQGEKVMREFEKRLQKYRLSF